MHFTTELVMLPEEAANEHIWKIKAIKNCGVLESEVNSISITRRSIDARSKTVRIRLAISVYTHESHSDPQAHHVKLNDVSSAEPVIIVGSGPAGLFAALQLIENGIKPVIIERGKPVQHRRRDLASLNKEHIVNPNSNYCFGEGGAGTYSDGKLYTRSGKKENILNVLKTFIHFGATNEIEIDAHPHIGTNKLPAIIESIRNAIIECGGEVHFNTRFISFQTSGNSVTGVNCESVGNLNKFSIKSKAIIIATGHSARDVYEYLHLNKIKIESKPFALGVRIEHPQEIIDKIQYHCEIRGQYLPAASYSLTAQSEGRGVYSFCMCPGGIIAAAATAPGEVVVNGWSPSKRNNPYANSGIVVTVNDTDFSIYNKFGELRGLRFQQQVEQAAYKTGGNNLTAPAQRMVDFTNNKFSSSLPTCSYIPGITSSELSEVLPTQVSTALKTALLSFGKKMRGYLTNEAILVATESRTSSPVRIPRDKLTLMHPELNGFFPCGEGAGYAGGIMSAAIDGKKIAESVKSYLEE